MGFYALFAAAIAAARKQAPTVAASAVIAAYYLGHLLPEGALRFYATSDCLWGFVIGIGIYHALPALLRVMHCDGRSFPLAVVAYIFAQIAVAAHAPVATNFLLTFVAPGALVVMARVAAKQGHDVQSPTLRSMGDASFAAYLIHTIMLAWLARHGIDAVWAGIAVAIVTWPLSVVVWRAIDQPIQSARPMWPHRRAIRG